LSLDPIAVAESVVGKTRWHEPTAGFCRCPGESLHTEPTRSRDCIVRVDGAPTIYCFHSSCAPVVAEANRSLRRSLGAEQWEVRLPGGRVVRSGQPAPADDDILRARRRNRSATQCLAAVEAAAAEKLDTVLDQFEWTYDQILKSSPLAVAHRPPEEQFRLWLKLWPPHSTIWIGDVFDSGSEESKSHFRPIADWYQLGPVMGNFTCAATFHPGATSRSNISVESRPFVVVESDVLSRDEVGAVFRFYYRRLAHRLRCIIDTAGKSLHAWFDAPTSTRDLARMRAGLTGLGCDPKMFNASQPARVPGVLRHGSAGVPPAPQKLIWISQ
jgi:hypothetical protein